VTAARERIERTWIQDFLDRLKLLNAFDWTAAFGAALLMSVLPLLILLSSLANTRIDDDLSSHIGLNRQGTRIVEGLFRAKPTRSIGTILISLIICLAGTVQVVASLQVVYERSFDQKHRGWRGLPRYLVWILVLIAVLVAQAQIGHAARSAVGPLAEVLVTLVGVGIFIWWTMHFLLAGRVPWRSLLPAALLTALAWVVFGAISSLLFASTLVSDSKLYGTIGVVFTLLTWFIAIGIVLLLGATLGAVWETRRARRAKTSQPRSSISDDAPVGGGPSLAMSTIREPD
jgi:membrane protein